MSRGVMPCAHEVRAPTDNMHSTIPIFNLIISVGCHAFLILGANVGGSKDVWPFLPCTSLMG